MYIFYFSFFFIIFIIIRQIFCEINGGWVSKTTLCLIFQNLASYFIVRKTTDVFFFTNKTCKKKTQSIYKIIEPQSCSYRHLRRILQYFAQGPEFTRYMHSIRKIINMTETICHLYPNLYSTNLKFYIQIKQVNTLWTL